MISNLFLFYLAALLPRLVLSQFQFLQPNGSLADFSQTFVVGSSVQISWKAGWRGYGQDPKYADLFVVSFESDAYISNVFANKSTAEGGAFAWRVNIPEDTIKSEKGKFVFKFVKALNPPNYAGANPAATLAPSRGFNIRLAASASSSTSSTTSSASLATSETSSPSSTPTSISAPSTTTRKRKNRTPIGAIIGGVIGGIVALVAIVFLLFKIMQKKKKAAAESQARELPAQHDYPNSGHMQDANYYKSSGYMPQELAGVQIPVEADSHNTRVHEK